MAVKAECTVEPSALMHSVSREERIARIGRLLDALAVCPMDVVTRCELAVMLEKLGQPDKALVNWNAVLACDPNSLTAREGVARCRQQAGRPFQSKL